MEIIFHKSFIKDAAKVQAKIRKQAQERVSLFQSDRFHPLLHFHALKGDFAGYYSINVNADVRIIFYLANNAMHLVRIGTHNQLYE